MINDDCYKFLKLDIVSDTDNMISVYSLYKLLNEYFEDFRILRYGNDKMINSMNNEYTFVDRIKNSMINPWFRKIFISEFNDNFIKMVIIVNPIYRRKEFSTNNIYYYVVKDRKSGNIYFENNVLKNRVFDKFYQEIINIFSLAEIYGLNFEEEGVISKAYNSLNPMHLQYLRQRKPNDTVCIYLTHTGQNKEMLKIAKDIRKYHAKSIVICDHKKREICKYCDETIVIMTTQNTTELSNAVYIASLQYVFNIFTSLKLISNYSYLEETTKVVDKFKMGE